MKKLSKVEARELIRLMHEDQSSRNPTLSSELALEIITTLSNWLRPSSYYSTIWLERWEEQEPVEAPVSLARSTVPDDDDVPF